jgi:hypothetical protein
MEVISRRLQAETTAESAQLTKNIAKPLTMPKTDMSFEHEVARLMFHIHAANNPAYLNSLHSTFPTVP